MDPNSILELNSKVVDPNSILELKNTTENIDNNNVYTSKVCTFEDQEYYSYRRNNDGRIYSVIGSKK